MDFNDSPEQAEFRAEVRQWLELNARKPNADAPARSMEDRYQEAKDWYKKVAKAGYSCLNWPKEYGGAGLSLIHKVIWSQEVGLLG